MFIPVSSQCSTPDAGDKLLHGHIDTVGFYAVSVLRRLYEPFRKFGGYILAVFIHKPFRPVFRYMAFYYQVEYLPPFICFLPWKFFHGWGPLPEADYCFWNSF
jgi:hypothetical protein